MAKLSYVILILKRCINNKFINFPESMWNVIFFDIVQVTNLH